MGRASCRLCCLRRGLRTDAAARGAHAWRDWRGDPAVLARGACDDTALGLCYRSRFHRLSRGARHHHGHRRHDFSEMADVPRPDRRGDRVRGRSRLCAHAPESASGHDRGLGIVGRRGDGHGADVRRLRRRHAAGRRDAISARRLRRPGGVACRPGLSAGWRGLARFDRLVSACGACRSPRHSGLRRRRRGHRGQIQASRRGASCADVRRRSPLSQPFAHDHAAALASGDLIRIGRLVHRPSIHARDGSLRLETIAGDPGVDLHADRALRRSRLRLA